MSETLWIVGILSPLLAAVEADGASMTKPLDIVALVQVTLTGLSLLVGALAAAYASIAAIRSKRAENAAKDNNVNISKVQDDVKLIERNTNSMTTRIAQLAEAKGVVIGEAKGVAAGEEKAATLAEGLRQGREAASGSLTATQDTPVSVADDRTATAGERVAEATERSAEAHQRVASATEEKK